MDKKVDLSALVGNAPRNSMSGRAPLAEGFEEDTPVAPAPAPVAMDVSDVPYDAFNIEANRPIIEQTDGEDVTALVSVDEDGKPSGVLVTDPTPPSPSPEPLSELDALKLMVLNLTKRLEDFGAIPKEIDTTPREPVVTITKAGNKRTDW